MRFIPASAADSAVVRVGPVVGTNDPSNGSMAAPQLISVGNGSARVIVRGLAADGSVVATDTVTEIVRQVARRVNVEPLRALMSAKDSIPVAALARDARGAVIADATTSVASAVNVVYHAPWAGPNANIGASVQAALSPGLTGLALPDSNPLAPQVPVVVNNSLFNILAADTVKAGQTQFTIAFALLDSTVQPLASATVFFATSFGPAPAAIVTDPNGQAQVTWIPPDSAASYTLTGVRPPGPGGPTSPDSAGRIVLRRSVEVIASDPSAAKSKAGISAVSIATNGTTTVTVTVKDSFGNVVKTAQPTDFTATATRGGVGAFACVQGICTATYTAPATTGADAISFKIGGVDIFLSPIVVTIT